MTAKEMSPAAFLPRLFWNNVPGHTTRAPSVGLELRLATNSIQFYAVANLDKTSHIIVLSMQEVLNFEEYCEEELHCQNPSLNL